MKSNFKRIVSILIALSFVITAFAGCQNDTRGDIKADYTSGVYNNFSSKPLKESQKLVTNVNKSAKKQNTVLVYMVGSDLESRGGYATSDLKEMASCYVDYSKTNVLVYAGGAKSWYINISSAQNTLLSLKDGDFYPVAATREAANMGYGSTLLDFLNFAYTNYPSDNYSLIFWNHGGGPIYGYGVDEQFNDRLYLHELEWALENSPFKNKKLSFIGFDACLMGTLETAQTFAPFANYFIASEELEPGVGWNYAFLSEYNSNPKPISVVNKILNYYESSLKIRKSYYTLSAFDLTKINTLVNAADKLFLEMAKDVLTGGFNRVAQSRYKTKRFGVQSNTKLENSYDLVDIYHMAQMLGSDYSSLTQNLRKAINTVVVGNVSSFTNTCGVSVYYPYDNYNSFLNGAEDSAKAYFNSYGYQAFIKAFASKWLKGRKQITWEDIKPSNYQPPSSPSSTYTPPSSTYTPPSSTYTPSSSVPASSYTSTSSENVSSETSTSSYTSTSSETSSVLSGYTPPPFLTSSNTSSAMSGYTPTYPQTSDTFSEIAIDSETEKNLAAALYTVLLFDQKTATYTPVLSECETQVKNGKIYLPENPYVYLIRTDRSNGLTHDGSMIYPATQVENGENEDIFVSQSILLSSGELIVGATEPVQVVFADDGKPEIVNILSTNEESDFYGKSDVDISRYTSIGNLTYSFYSTKTVDGVLLPCDEWSTDGSYTATYLPYGEKITVEKKRVSELDGEFYIELKLKNTQGDETSYSFTQLSKATAPMRVTQISPDGTLFFNVYSDHAELVDFGKRFNFDGDLEIPDKVNLKPVTVIAPEVFKGMEAIESVTLPKHLKVIGQGAFRACYNLEKVVFQNELECICEEAFYACDLESITLPSSLKTIGWRAFASTDIETVNIPQNVFYVGTGAFYGCENLKAITTSSPNYTSVDGVLFTADKKTLVSYPAAKGESYLVPDGTEVIFAEAFREAELLKKVSFPESLKKIESLAFCDTLNLSEITLPSSLESISSAAFGKSMTKKVSGTVLDITIPEKVTFIGEDAFSGYLVSGYNVAENNANYACVDGYLLNKTKTKLVFVPSNISGDVTLPECVNYVDSGAFEGCSKITSLTLPDSVVAMSIGAGVPSGVKKITVGKGMINFNNLKHYMGVEIVVSPDNPNYKVENGVVYSADMTKLYLFNSNAEYYAMPDTVEEIVSGTFNGLNTTLKTITLSKALSKMPNGAFGTCSELESIYVPEENQTYLSDNGILYSKDGTVLLACPMGKSGDITLRDGTVEIGIGALYNTFYFKATSLTLPNSVRVIRESNLMNANPNVQLQLHISKNVTDIHKTFLKNISQDKIILHAPIGSVAYKYGKSSGVVVKAAK